MAATVGEYPRSDHEGGGGDAEFVCSHGLRRGAAYVLAVETAAARLGLIVAPLRAALSVGRSCALITPLSPEQFAGLICRSRNAREVAASIKSGRLKLFTAVGDYAANLFLHGAAGYVRELDHFGLDAGSLIVVDQADDLFTPHDHLAVVQQARTYREWCEERGHTMLQLHLRTSLAHPVLGGNQAAAQYFSGVARVTSESGGLCLRIDFWRSLRGYHTGAVLGLDRLAGFSSEKGGRHLPGGAPIPRESFDPSLSPRLPVWYLGPNDASLDQLRGRIHWRFARSLDDLLQPGRRKKGASVLINLGGPAAFQEFVDRMAEFRAVFGGGGRIIVRESGYRLREHPQRKALLAAGVDCFLAESVPMSKLPEILGAPRQPRQGESQTDIKAAVGDLLCATRGETDSVWLPPPDFVEEAREAMRRAQRYGVPFALAEVCIDGNAGRTDGPGAATAMRQGDFGTSVENARLFFLRGCRELDVVRVLSRWADRAGVGRLHRVSLFTGQDAIAERLEGLRWHGEPEGLAVEVALGKGSGNIVAMPSAGRAVLTHGHPAMLAVAALVLGFLAPSAEVLAGEAAPNPATPATAAQGRTASRAYEEGRYAEAARLGLIELGQRGSDHDLRFKVANSLAWTGQYPEAIRQYEALAGTRLANEASLGLANVYLWTGYPERADPLFRRVLEANPANRDAREGLEAAGRQLRPRTALKAGWMDDSSNTERSGLGLAHRWRDSSRQQVFEVAAEGIRENRAPDIPDVTQRELAFSYEHLGLALQPRIQIAAQQSPTTKAFGSLALRLADGAVTLDAGRVNWGKLVFDPRALDDGLTANRAGIEGRADTGIGNWQGTFAHFAVSDGNRVQDANLRFTPSLQPFSSGSGVRLFAGLYGRKADRKADHYWSPASGFYTGYLGLAADLAGPDWDISAEVKRSQRLGGEGANGWSGGLGGRRWLSRDWAIRADGFWLETRRDESAYRFKSLTISLERLW